MIDAWRISAQSFNNRNCIHCLKVLLTWNAFICCALRNSMVAFLFSARLVVADETATRRVTFSLRWSGDGSLARDSVGTDSAADVAAVIRRTH